MMVNDWKKNKTMSSTLIAANMNSSNFDIKQKTCKVPRQTKPQCKVGGEHEVSYTNGGVIAIDNYRKRCKIFRV